MTQPLNSSALISVFPSSRSVEVGASHIGSTVFMELGLGRQSPPGLAGGKPVVSARDSRPAHTVDEGEGGASEGAHLDPATQFFG